jgi:hypothetical protein
MYPGYTIPGIGGEKDIFSLPLCTGSRGDHFVDVNNMIKNRIVCIFTGYTQGDCIPGYPTASPSSVRV